MGRRLTPPTLWRHRCGRLFRRICFRYPYPGAVGTHSLQGNVPLGGVASTPSLPAAFQGTTLSFVSAHSLVGFQDVASAVVQPFADSAHSPPTSDGSGLWIRSLPPQWAMPSTPGSSDSTLRQEVWHSLSASSLSKPRPQYWPVDFKPRPLIH